MILFRRLPTFEAADPAGEASAGGDPRRQGSWIISARVSHAEQPQRTQPLSIRAAWGGIERCFVDNRTIAVDDDGYLILNDRRGCAILVDSEVPVHTFTIVFRPGLPEQLLGDMLTPTDHALERGSEPAHRPFEFAEFLQPHDHSVTPVLRYISYHVDLGVEDETWYDEQLNFLLERMLLRHRHVVEAMQRLTPVRGATRREIYRRIGLATDFIHANYQRALAVDDLAEAACMSKYHFVRLFREVHGTTPHAFLQAKRTRVAKRLLDTSDAGLDEIAVQCGFDNRVTLFRNLRRALGRSGSGLRGGTWRHESLGQ